ncbi:MAG: OadG family protein [Firmicutes bacterium]|nr:OadG family protein [Bacillota bacterium]
MANIGILDTAIVALLGYGVVFFGLILLMIVVTIMGKCFVAAENRKKKAVEAAVAAITPAEIPAEEPKPLAPGSAGELKLHDVEPKTAAMLMAIVADKMGKPLNELRFISIKEVK